MNNRNLGQISLEPKSKRPMKDMICGLFFQSRVSRGKVDNVTDVIRGDNDDEEENDANADIEKISQ